MQKTFFVPIAKGIGHTGPNSHMLRGMYGLNLSEKPCLLVRGPCGEIALDAGKGIVVVY